MFPGAVAGGARAAAQAPHPTHLPLSRLCTKRRVTKGDQEAAILSSVQGKRKTLLKPKRETVAQTNEAVLTEAYAGEKEREPEEERDLY